jgi:hypothetical protein
VANVFLFIEPAGSFLQTDFQRLDSLSSGVELIACRLNETNSFRDNRLYGVIG